MANLGSRLLPSPKNFCEAYVEVNAPDDKNGPVVTRLFPLNHKMEEKMDLQQIPKFCFPCNVYSNEAVQNFTFILTDLESKWRFGFCRYPPFAKTCVCILSYLPWFGTFYNILNTIAELERKQPELATPFIEAMMKMEVPEREAEFTITPENTTRTFSFVSSDSTKLPSIPENRIITDYFSAVDPGNMVKIFASMMLERRIIICSKKLSLLTACTYGAAYLLYPMYWQHVFIPIMPAHLLPVCCAPMPFLVGVHSSMMEEVRTMPLSEVVILNADTNELEYSYDDDKIIPEFVIHELKSTLKKPQPGCYVARAFLSAMVTLIGSYRDALIITPGEKIDFDRESFITTRTSSMKPFLEHILQLQQFEQFIAGRLELLNSGKGFDDIFEEHIGLHAGSVSKFKHYQYQQWVGEMKSASSVLLLAASKKAEKYGHNAKSAAKKGLKGAKKGVTISFREVRDGIKEAKKDIKGKFKSKDDLDAGNDFGRKSQTMPRNPDALSPRPRMINRHSVPVPTVHAERLCKTPPPPSNRIMLQESKSTSRIPPPRPPPPRPAPFAVHQDAYVRPRTKAITLSEKRNSSARHSSVSLGELISFDHSGDGVTTTTTDSQESNQDSSNRFSSDFSDIIANNADTPLKLDSDTLLHAESSPELSSTNDLIDSSCKPNYTREDSFSPITPSGTFAAKWPPASVKDGIPPLSPTGGVRPPSLLSDTLESLPVEVKNFIKREGLWTEKEINPFFPHSDSSNRTEGLHNVFTPIPSSSSLTDFGEQSSDSSEERVPNPFNQNPSPPDQTPEKDVSVDPFEELLQKTRSDLIKVPSNETS